MTFATAQQDRVNRASLRAFGGTVQLDGVDVQGDFTDAMAAREVAGIPVDASRPMCLVLDADVPAAPVGKPLVPDGATTYYVIDTKPDGHGFTLLILSLDAPT